jgi:hypothetical protein
VNKSVERGESFFARIARQGMSPAERIVYDLRLEREALVRDSTDYHKAQLDLQSRIKPGAAQDAALEKLNTEFPLGYRRKELMACNAAIMKATTDLNRCLAGNLKPGEYFGTKRPGQHFNTRKIGR